MSRFFLNLNFYHEQGAIQILCDIIEVGSTNLSRRPIDTCGDLLLNWIPLFQSNMKTHVLIKLENMYVSQAFAEIRHFQKCLGNWGKPRHFRKCLGNQGNLNLTIFKYNTISPQFFYLCVCVSVWRRVFSALPFPRF